MEHNCNLRNKTTYIIYDRRAKTTLRGKNSSLISGVGKAGKSHLKWKKSSEGTMGRLIPYRNKLQRI